MRTIVGFNVAILSQGLILANARSFEVAKKSGGQNAESEAIESSSYIKGMLGLCSTYLKDVGLSDSDKDRALVAVRHPIEMSERKYQDWLRAPKEERAGKLQGKQDSSSSKIQVVARFN